MRPKLITINNTSLAPVNDTSKSRSLTTFTGKMLDPVDLKVSDIDIKDIGHALSMICRYGGHLPNPYSVAEHCLNVSARVWQITRSPELTLAGLLHDASEAYLGDMIVALKYSPAMAAYKEIEIRTEAVIEQHFGLPEGILAEPQIKTVDKEIVIWEKVMIRDAPWRTPTPPATVKLAYLQKFGELTTKTLDIG